MTEVKKSKEPEFKTILPGGVGEFFHIVGNGRAAIGLRIPIDEVKDIDSAKAKAKKEGFEARYDQNNKYLEIAKYGYQKEYDQEVVKKLKEVAIAVSTEDYSNHIKDLQLTPDEEDEVGGRWENVHKRNPQLTPTYKEEKEYGEKERLGIGEEVSEETQNDLNPLTHILIRILVDKIKKLCNDLGIPIVSSVEESKKFPNSTVIFASKHDDYNTEPGEIKEILFQKLNSSNKKTIVGFEFCSNFADVLNDPTKNLNDKELNRLLSMAIYRKTLRGLIEVFNEVQQEYSKDRFEIQPFDITYNKLLLEEENDEKRDAQVAKNILDLLKTYEDNNNLVIWTGMLHVIDLLTKFREIIGSENNKEIKTNNIVVFLTPETLSNIRRK